MHDRIFFHQDHSLLLNWTAKTCNSEQDGDQNWLTSPPGISECVLNVPVREALCGWLPDVPDPDWIGHLSAADVEVVVGLLADPAIQSTAARAVEAAARTPRVLVLEAHQHPEGAREQSPES